jgi:hypothetical protein
VATATVGMHTAALVMMKTMMMVVGEAKVDT